MKIAQELGRPPVTLPQSLPHGNPAGIEPAPLPFAALVAAYAENAGAAAARETASLTASSHPARSLPGISSLTGTAAPGTVAPIPARPTGSARPGIAAIRPAIGEGAHAFCASALLVGTAFQPKAASAGAEPRVAQPVSGAAPSPALAESDPAMPAASRFEAGRAASMSGFAPASSQGGGMPGLAIMPKGASPAAMPSPATASAPSRPGPSGQMQPDPHHRAEESAASARSQSTPAGASSPATATALAQFVPLEGGLRLVLRLPRLPDDMRAELEARLHQLLTAFGHSRHELLIRESGQG